MNKKPIYLDYMATTPVDPRVVKCMMEYLGPDACFGNASSVTHLYGKEAASAIARARTQVADTIGASPDEIIFTSGATEANNLAILGAARFYQRKGRHVLTMSIEHRSVLDSFQQLEREGFEVTYLNPDKEGLLDLTSLEQALRADTILVSVMHVNNEIGVIQSISDIGALLKNKGIVFHVDAAQSAGRLALNIKNFHAHLVSLSAHKNYGPKGIGALYVQSSPRIRLQALSFGGGQEQGLRSGSLATHQIVGMGEAFAVSELEREQEQARILNLRQQLWNGIKHLPGIYMNGHAEKRIAGNLNFGFKHIPGKVLLQTLDRLAFSVSAACSSDRMKASHVLKAISLSEELTNNSIRLSLGRFTTEAEIRETCELICDKIPLLS